MTMPRASWKGSLRLSLVSCPVYLSPATTRTKSVRLHQVWVPRNELQDEPGDADPEDEQLPPSGRAQAPEEHARAGAGGEPEDAGPATRIALRPYDPYTGEEIEREEVTKGYEYERGQLVTLRADELKALDVESSRTIDLTTFIPRADVDPLFFSTPYYVYPDGPVAVEPYRVINAAMAEGGLAIVALGPAVFHRHVLSLDISGFTQPLAERGQIQ